MIGPEPDDIEYLGSQPWPFPCSLMLGYHARASQTEIKVDGDEIAEVPFQRRIDHRDRRQKRSHKTQRNRTERGQ